MKWPNPLAWLTLLLSTALQAHTPTKNPDLTTALQAVVNIRTFAQGHSDSIPNRFGSGVIINGEKGYIVTNAHVIGDQTSSVITLANGEQIPGTVIGKSESFDLAVVQVHTHPLTAISYAKKAATVGMPVWAIGSPFGLKQSVTAGIVSALERTEITPSGSHEFIQTDAPINMGNSGGALINPNGQLIGINTAIVTPNAGNIGIGFAIPYYLVKRITQELITHGSIEPGMLGLLGQNLSPQLAQYFHRSATQGVLVSSVTDGSPAQAAGIEPTDIITQLNDNPINSISMLHSLLSTYRPNTPITLTISHAGKNHTRHAILARRNDLPTQKRLPFLDGADIQMTEQLYNQPHPIHGAQLTMLTPNSKAQLAGFQAGDIITKLNKTPITSIHQLTEQLSQLSSVALFTVYRQHNYFYLAANP